MRLAFIAGLAAVVLGLLAVSVTDVGASDQVASVRSPVATGFLIPDVPVNTQVVIDAVDMVSAFGSDSETPLGSTSITLISARVGGVAVAGPTAAGVTYVPGAGRSGHLSLDPTISPYAGLVPGASTTVEVDYLLTNTNGQTATSIIRFNVVGQPGEFDEVAIDFRGVGVSGQGVSASRTAAPGTAAALVVLTGPGPVDNAIAGLSFTTSDIGNVAMPGVELAIAKSVDGGEATATASDESRAMATSGTGSVSIASAIDGSTATAFATDHSVASAEAVDVASAQAAANISSAATATAQHNSTSIAVADRCSAAESSATVDSDVSALAEETSNATATASNVATSTATADRASSATAFSAEHSDSTANADLGSIANSISLEASVASSAGREDSDALAFGITESAASATATSNASASAGAKRGSVAESSATDSNSISSAVNASIASTTARASSNAIAEAVGGTAVVVDAADGTNKSDPARSDIPQQVVILKAELENQAVQAVSAGRGSSTASAMPAPTTDVGCSASPAPVPNPSPAVSRPATAVVPPSEPLLPIEGEITGGQLSCQQAADGESLIITIPAVLSVWFTPDESIRVTAGGASFVGESPRGGVIELRTTADQTTTQITLHATVLTGAPYTLVSACIGPPRR